MKRLLKVGFLLAVALVLTVSAMAADELGAGFYDIGSHSNVTIVPQTKNGDEVSGTPATDGTGAPNVTYYEGVEKFKVTYTGEIAEGDQFLVMLVTGTGMPEREDSIYYINQDDESDGAVTFTVYPRDITKNTALTLFITSNRDDFNGNPIQIAMNYSTGGEFEKVPYVLGDVDTSGEIDAVDASLLLQYLVGSADLTDSQILAADVDLSKEPDAVDASYILQYVVDIITDFSQVQNQQ